MSKNVETALYSEEGWEAKVEILENNSNGEWERYKLKVIETLHNSGPFKTPPNGYIFSVSCKKGMRAYVGWMLYKN